MLQTLVLLLLVGVFGMIALFNAAFVMSGDGRENAAELVRALTNHHCHISTTGHQRTTVLH
jgi:hypothetical protein